MLVVFERFAVKDTDHILARIACIRILMEHIPFTCMC
jgi:hypothetical protein